MARAGRRDRLVDQALEERIRELEEEIAELRFQQEPLLARLAELAALQKVTSAANSDLHLDATLALIVETVAEVMRADVCSVYLLETPDRLVLRATKGLNPELVGRVSLRLGEGITGAAARERQVVALRDAWVDPRFVHVYGLYEEPYPSMASVPIILRAMNRLVGVLNVHFRSPKDFAPEEIRFMEAVASHIAIALENAQVYEQTDQRLRQKLDELTTLHRVTAAIASSLDPGQVLRMVALEAVSLSRTDAAAIYLLDPAGQELALAAYFSAARGPALPDRFAIDEGIVGRAVRERRPVVAGAVTEAFRAAICVPLTAQQTYGGLCLYTRRARDFTDDEINLLVTFGDETALALENARLYEEAQRSLAVKTALLAEMHHRVKNNLQTVAALLSLQARRAQSDEVAAPLRESVGRVQSIAAIHDLLSRKEPGVASVADVARGIADILGDHPVRPRAGATVVVEGEEILLSSRQAMVFALVLNELVTNALRHGFGGRSGGTIAISAQQPQEQTIAVEVRDNGRGLPADFDLERHRGLGLQIVQTLVEKDLRGSLQLRSSPEAGTIVLMAFPIEPAAP
ncbi:MAG: GAF domain-containing protein [Chloroflexi bacterium]|nr:GAF domain-containing protein [Chloroflexota bacterium]